MTLQVLAQNLAGPGLLCRIPNKQEQCCARVWGSCFPGGDLVAFGLSMSDDQKPQAANLLRLKCSASDRRHPGCSDSEFFCEAVSIQLRRVWAAASRQDGCHSILDLSQGTPGFALTLVCSRILACVIELFELRKGVFKTTANGHCFVECAEVKTFLDRDVAGRVLRNAFLGCAKKSRL